MHSHRQFVPYLDRGNRESPTVCLSGYHLRRKQNGSWRPQMTCWCVVVNTEFRIHKTLGVLTFLGISACGRFCWSWFNRTVWHAVVADAGCRCSEQTAEAGVYRPCLIFHTAHSSASKSVFSLFDVFNQHNRSGWWIPCVCVCACKFMVCNRCSLGSHGNPLPSARQHLSYGDCLEVKREYCQNCSVLDCVTQCSQSAAHLWAVQQIGFLILFRFMTKSPVCWLPRNWDQLRFQCL